jgi:hypothetical protein
MVRFMTRILPPFLLLCALAAPAAAADHNYSVTDFDRVIVEGPYAVHLVVGPPSSAVATGSREALDRLTVDVQGQTLRIRRNSSAWGGSQGADVGPVTIALATRNLRSARIIGAGQLDVAGGRGLNLEFVLQGSGRLRATGIAADNLSLGLLGSGRLEIAGTARALHADIQGNGDVEASHLAAQNAIVSTSTAGTVAVMVNGPVIVTANGLGEVAILGAPVCTVQGLGADRVRCPASNQR